MAICPVYCEKDPGGPLSLAEASQLAEWMRRRACELIADNQQVGRGSDATFHHACGQEQALSFTLDILSRLIVDPSQIRVALFSAAERLDNQAAELRRRAEAPSFTEDPRSEAEAPSEEPSLLLGDERRHSPRGEKVRENCARFDALVPDEQIAQVYAAQVGLALSLRERERLINEARQFLTEFSAPDLAAPLRECDLSSVPEWLPLAKPRYQTAALVFTALQVMGEYPAGASDYDAAAVAHLRSALARLTPGFGDLEILGEPHPPKSAVAESSEEPTHAPDWVGAVLAEEGRGA